MVTRNIKLSQQTTRSLQIQESQLQLTQRQARESRASMPIKVPCKEITKMRFSIDSSKRGRIAYRLRYTFANRR